MCEFDDFNFDWEDMASAGALAEEIAEEQKGRAQEEDVFDLDKENAELEDENNF